MKICLVVIFNHRYEKNVDLLRRIYSERFSNIVFLIPFYQGDDKEVITVYGSSYCFQSFVAQALDRLKAIKADYYFFISDDMLLNPKITENNLLHELNIDGGDTLITGAIPLQDCYFWTMKRISDAIYCFDNKRYEKYVNWENELYDRKEAFNIAASKGYRDFDISFADKWRFKSKDVFLKRTGLHQIRDFLKTRCLPYPMWGGYSDWFLLSGDELELVARHFGVTASMNVFVEIAVPTIIILDCHSVKSLKETRYKDGSIWSVEELNRMKEEHDLNLSNLLANFSDNTLYFHPIKLSEWRL